MRFRRGQRAACNEQTDSSCMQLVTNLRERVRPCTANEYTALVMPAEAKRNALCVQPDAASRCGND
jgi:hypothetical protein